MPIAHALLTAIFLILVAVSAAVVVSMAVLALFDLAFGKRKLSKVAEQIEDSQPEQSKPKAGESTPKPKLLTAFKRNRRSDPQAGCGPETQRVRHLR